MERSSKFEDAPVKLFVYPSVLFMVFGMLVGTFISFNAFVLPDYFAGEYVHFGRLRPVHVGTVTLLWLISANIGLFYYFVQRLCGVPLWNKQLAMWSGYIWWSAITLGVMSFPFGTNFGWEYAELPVWLGPLPIKLLGFIGYGLVGVNVFMTIFNRRYKKMYVSLWYAMGAMIWGAVTYVIGNFGVNWVPEGISRVNTSFFFVHNLVGLIFTPMGLGIAYYFLPKQANAPIYSHKLSMIGFWSIAFVYAWVGAHHIIHGPVSQWLQTVSIIFSIWLFVPVWTAVTNLFATLKGNWQAYNNNVAVRFIIMGTLFYLVVSTQGSFMALRNVNEITSKTDWVIGHSHMALLGTFSFYAMAGIYSVLPVLTGRPMYSKRLGDWHFTLSMLGIMLMMFSLHICGFIQGLEWSTWADGSSYAQFHSNLTKLSFLQTVADMKTWWLIRLLSGVIITAANCIFLVNMFNTILLKSPEHGGERKIMTRA